MNRITCRVCLLVVCLLAAVVTARAWNVPLGPQHLIGTTWNAAGLAGDVDRDGDPDLIIQTTASNVVWVRNVDAASSNWTGAVIQTNALPLALGDLDGDGDLDVVSRRGSVGAAYPILLIHENDGGAGTGWVTRTLATSFTLGATIDHAELADVDRDGWPDLVARRSGLSLALLWFRNTGSTNQWPFYEIDNRDEPFQIADFDRDGDPDVSISVIGMMRIYRNDPGATSDWPIVSVAVNAGTASAHAWNDMDNDGDPDLVVTRTGSVWYANNGSGGGWTTNPLPDSFQVGPVQGDFDRDGDEDFAHTNFWYDHPGRTGQAWQRRPLGDPSPAPQQLLASADFDHDGDLDVLLGTASNRLYWIANHRPALPLGFEGQRIVGNDLTDPYDLEVADLDRDGDLDVVASDLNSRLVWYRNNGPGTTFLGQYITASNIANDFLALAVADFDADGDPDVAVSDYSNGQLLWFGNADGQGTAWTTNLIDAPLTRIIHESCGCALFLGRAA